MLEDKKKYEKEVMKIFDKIMKKNQQKFFKKNIIIGTPKMDIIKSEDNLYTSEVSVCLYLKNDIFAVIEFFIFYNGHPKASLSEFQEWFQNEFEYFFSKS